MKDRSNPASRGLPKAVRFPKISPDPLPVQVLKSAAGYYLGTEHEGQPVSRESEDYYQSATAAKAALDEGTWTARRDRAPSPIEYSDHQFSSIPVRQGNAERRTGAAVGADGAKAAGQHPVCEQRRQAAEKQRAERQAAPKKPRSR